MPKNKPKILYIITQGEWGGAQRYVYDLVSNLKNNFEVIIAVGEPNGKQDLQTKMKLGNWETGKLKVIELKHLVRRIFPLHDILSVFELAKLYRRLKPDIVHLNSSKAGILGSLAKLLNLIFLHLKFKIKNLKLVYTVHGWVFNEPSRKTGRWLYRFLEKFTARWKDKIIVLSDRDLADGIKLGIDEKKLVKIPLGIETQKFLDKNEAREKIFSIIKQRDSSVATLPQNDRYVGTIANFYPSKGLDVLIEAIKIQDTRHKIQDKKFIVIGDGPERKNLELRIMNYELGDIIHLVGAIENAAQYLKAFDLFALPSRKEGMPYTILEAMMGKVPVIATNAGGVSELIENKKTGLLVQPEDPQELADSILYAIENPQEMQKMADKAFLEAKKFSLDQMIEKTNSIHSALFARQLNL